MTAKVSEQKVVSYGVEATIGEFLSAFGALPTVYRKSLWNILPDANLSDTLFLPVENREDAEKIAAIVGKSTRYVPVRSTSRPDVIHIVHKFNGVPIACTCEDFVYNGNERCKHMRVCENQLHLG